MDYLSKWKNFYWSIGFISSSTVKIYWTDIERLIIVSNFLQPLDRLLIILHLRTKLNILFIESISLPWFLRHIVLHFSDQTKRSKPCDWLPLLLQTSKSSFWILMSLIMRRRATGHSFSPKSTGLLLTLSTSLLSQTATIPSSQPKILTFPKVHHIACSVHLMWNIISRYKRVKILPKWYGKSKDLA